MVSRILVPIDRSARTAAALRTAISLARREGAAVRLVHVIDSPLRGDEEDEPFVGTPEEAIEAITRNGGRLLAAAQGVVVSWGVSCATSLFDSADGEVGQLIAFEAARWRADVVVLPEALDVAEVALAALAAGGAAPRVLTVG